MWKNMHIVSTNFAKMLVQKHEYVTSGGLCSLGAPVQKILVASVTDRVCLLLRFDDVTMLTKQ